jgi:hypothetical protein
MLAAVFAALAAMTTVALCGQRDRESQGRSTRQQDELTHELVLLRANNL